MWVSDVVNACADTVEAIVGRQRYFCGHCRVFSFCASARTVLAIAGNVENRSKLLLQRQRLSYQFFGPGVMIHRGQYRERFLTGKQNVGRVLHVEVSV